jgi:hypothetical protein
LVLWGDGSTVRTSGSNLVIAGTDNNRVLHIRSFDANTIRADTSVAMEGGTSHVVTVRDGASGNVSSDVPVSSLSAAQAQALAELEAQLLLGWLSSHVLTQSQKTAVLDEATLITGYPSSLGVDNHAALLRYRGFNSMIVLNDFAGQNWLITPAALAVGETPPADIYDQKWLLVLSGVVLANIMGAETGGWNRQTVSFIPDMAGPDDPTATSGPLNWAIGQYNIPRPPGTVGTDYLVRFSLEDSSWSPFVSLSSVFDQAQAINAGFAVDDWRPNHFDSGTDVVTGQTVNNIFTGVNADVGVSDSDAWLYRLSYNITLLGKIVFIAPVVIF